MFKRFSLCHNTDSLKTFKELIESGKIYLDFLETSSTVNTLSIYKDILL